jgi:hypothetical protein
MLLARDLIDTEFSKTCAPEGHTCPCGATGSRAMTLQWVQSEWLNAKREGSSPNATKATESARRPSKGHRETLSVVSAADTRVPSRAG